MIKKFNISNSPKDIGLSREIIVDGLVHKLAKARDGKNSNILSSEDLVISRQKYIPDNYEGPDIWVFGYGSLIWNPLMKYSTQEKVKIYGYHRKFCLWTKIGRGTPEYPGLILGLINGGSVEGIAFKISSKNAVRELDLLWKREMLNNSYEPKWLKVFSKNKQMQALTFVVKKDCPNYAKINDHQEVSKIISNAKGYIGPCSQYLFETHNALKKLKINDNYISSLMQFVTKKN